MRFPEACLTRFDIESFDAYSLPGPMTDSRPFHLADAVRLIARGLAGDLDSLVTTVSMPLTLLDRHRAVPGLTRALRTRALPIPEPWQQRQTSAAVHWMRLEAARAEVSAALDEAGVRWLPFKGCDVADRYYAAPEERPTSDLDVLVLTDQFTAARAALEASGWLSLSEDPLVERYRADEGYAWPANRPGRPLLEVHFRLWGMTPATLSDSIVEDARPVPGLFELRPTPADAYLLAAIHHLLIPPPRPMIGLLDLARIAAADDSFEVSQLAQRADHFGLALPVVMATLAAHTLWPRDRLHSLAVTLGGQLRGPERFVAARAARGGLDTISTAAVVLARLLSGRPSRAGWRTIPRRVWAHPGVVASETPASWPWHRRRKHHVLQQLGLRKP